MKAFKEYTDAFNPPLQKAQRIKVKVATPIQNALANPITGVNPRSLPTFPVAAVVLKYVFLRQ